MDGGLLALGVERGGPGRRAPEDLVGARTGDFVDAVALAIADAAALAIGAGGVSGSTVGRGDSTGAALAALDGAAVSTGAVLRAAGRFGEPATK